MSELAKTARKDAKEKIDRLMADPHQKVDASSWSPPEALNADVQTGPRPVSRQNFKHGGHVKAAPIRVIDGIQVRRGDRKPRATGGNAMATPNNLQNRDLKEANELRNGTKHVGGFKKGGSVHADAAEDKKLIRETMHKDGCKCAKCSGGRVGRASGGGTKLDGEIQGTRPTGGRLARKDGGKAGKGKMNVNIIIAAGGKGQQPMPSAPMPMPPGGPVGLRQGVPPPPPMIAPGGPPPGAGMPMARRSGGRTYEAGAGSGLGRLEKIKNYGGA